MAQFSKSDHATTLDFGDTDWNPTSAIEFRRPDPKILGSSTTNSGYQQTPIPGGGGFSQICMQALEI